MPHVRRFDHVGLTVADLDVVTAFFVALGLEVEGRTFVEGEFLDTVCGIPGSRTEIVMLKPPGDGTRLELSSFVRPDSVPGSPAAMANELGLRNVAFEVSDLQAAVDWAATEGYGLVGGIGEYEGAWRMAYVRGPEGIIVSLAERIGCASQRPHLPPCGPWRTLCGPGRRSLLRWLEARFTGSWARQRGHGFCVRSGRTVARGCPRWWWRMGSRPGRVWIAIRCMRGSAAWLRCWPRSASAVR